MRYNSYGVCAGSSETVRELLLLLFDTRKVESFFYCQRWSEVEEEVDDGEAKEQTTMC